MYFSLFLLKTCINLRGCPATVNVFITVNTFHDNNETKSRWFVYKKRRKLSGGPASWPVLIRVESADQTLDALQLVGGVFLCASFWGHGDRAGRHGGRVAGNLRCGIQGGCRHRAGRDDAVPLQLGPAADHRGHGGGEQGAVRYRHGKGVGAVPESGAHCVQEGVPMNRRGGGSSRRCCGRCCHVRVRIREQTAKRRHGNALWRNVETECELQGWCGRRLTVCRHALENGLNACWYRIYELWDSNRGADVWECFTVISSRQYCYSTFHLQPNNISYAWLQS